MNGLPGIKDVLFLDIETVPGCQKLADVEEALREIWIEKETKPKKEKKAKKKAEASDEDAEAPAKEDCGYGDAGLKAEFGKVICVCLGRYDEAGEFKGYSIYSDDEREILKKLSDVLAKYPHCLLCAHNGKGFDFPFLGKRYLINGMPLPAQLNIMGRKPWEVPHVDTCELWTFGAKGNGNSASLKLLCAVFGIPSPKDDIDGSQVRKVYYEDHDLPRIARYCEKDVDRLARVYRKIIGE